MHRIVNDIRKVIAQKQDILFEQLNFGACDASLDVFKSKIELELPEIFYHFYAAFNGSVDGALPMWGKMKLLPLSKTIQEKEILDNKIKSNWNLNWVPFLMENQFSYICINL